MIGKAIKLVWFSAGLESPGIEHSDEFNPISLPTIAFVVTVVSASAGELNAVLRFNLKIEFCIDKWLDTGRPSKDNFVAAKYAPIYLSHLSTLRDLRQMVPKPISSIQQKLWSAARSVNHMSAITPNAQP